MNLHRHAPPHSKRFGPTLMTPHLRRFWRCGVRLGQGGIPARLGRSQFSDGTRKREEIRSAVGTHFAYIVQTEHIQFRVPGRTEESTLDLRVTMVFRREADGWRIVHRQADSQRSTQLP